jgi:hypothetical protein
MASRRDRGVVSGFVVSLGLSLFVMSGLAIDSGRLVAARTEAADHAENAARLAAQEITLIRLGVRTIDPLRARSVVASYFDRHDVDGTVVIDHQSVSVTVRAEQDTTLLHLVGIDSRSLSATRTASVVAG